MQFMVSHAYLAETLKWLICGILIKEEKPDGLLESQTSQPAAGNGNLWVPGLAGQQVYKKPDLLSTFHSSLQEL